MRNWCQRLLSNSSCTAYTPAPPQAPPLISAAPNSLLENKLAATCAHDGVSFETFDRRDLLRAYGGSSIIFVGDSMVRQMFLRLVHWIQGRTASCEHYFHTVGLYKWNEVDK